MPFLRPSWPRALPVLLAMLSSGCTVAPEQLCAHLIRLTEDQWGPIDRQQPQQGRMLALRKCSDEHRRRRASNKKGYDCFAACVLDKRNLVDAAECKARCYGPDPAEAEPATTSGSATTEPSP